MNLIDNLKKYFAANGSNASKLEAPEGICPNCWGKQEWEGQFYKKIKANNITPDHKTYNSFIHEVAEKLDKITLKEDTYTCETCNTKYEK